MRWLTSLLGLAGGFLLYVSLAPVLLSGINSKLLTEWKNAIIVWPQNYIGYLIIALVIIAITLIGIGLIGAIISPIKPISGKRLMVLGGIATITLLGALWIGFLDLHILFLGSTDMKSHLMWDRSWGIAQWTVSREIMSLGNGWLKPAIAGGILLLSTGLLDKWNNLK